MKILGRSFKNEYGEKYIYCNECVMGGNDMQTCKYGKKIKRPKDTGCGKGILLDIYKYSQALNPEKKFELTLFD